MHYESFFLTAFHGNELITKLISITDKPSQDVDTKAVDIVMENKITCNGFVREILQGQINGELKCIAM